MFQGERKVKMFSSFLLLILSTSAANASFKLQILHTNDMHARFDEINLHGGMCSSNKSEDCYGGFARVKQAVNDAKEEARLGGYPSIFLNAGDNFQGTPYYTLFKWKIVAPLIDALGIDVMSLGNHEFDDGIDNLVQYLKNIKTPTVACNLNFTSEKRLKIPILTPSYNLTIDNVTIGVVGYLLPDTKYMSKTENLEIYDEIQYLKAETQRLRKSGIKIIIALGHSGFTRDVVIAKSVPEIDVVVGGHSHSLLYTPPESPPSVEPAIARYPYMVTSKSGKKIPVVQAYCHTKYLGKLIVTFDDNGDVITAEGNTILLNSTIKKDPDLEKLVSDWSVQIKEKIEEVRGATRVFLAKQNATDGRYESNLANLLTDSFVDYGVQYAVQEDIHSWTDAPIAFLQDGGIRIEIDYMKNNGSITEGDILTLLPFHTDLCMARYKGSTIKKALEHSVATMTPDGHFVYFLFASGLKAVYDFSQPVGNRVKSVTVLCRRCSIPQYNPLKLDQVYNVILNDFLAEGGDKYGMFKDERLNITKLGITDTDAFLTYLKKVKIVYPALEGRVSVEQLSLASATAFVSFYTFLIVPVSFIYTNSLT